MEKIISITLLISIIIAIICILIVIIDYYKQWKLIEKYYKTSNKN
jgi:hypothetical protein